MSWNRNNSLGWVFVSRMIVIICFLIIVVLAKILTTFTIPGGLFQKTVEGILFANFWLLLLMAVILLIADIFGAFPFPLNLPEPIIRAFGVVFCIAFVLSVFPWVDSTFGTTLYPFSWVFAFLIVPLVFLIVLASGYLKIMRQLWRQPKLTDTGAEVGYQEFLKEPEQPVSDAKSWDEIGTEFRMMLYDIIHRFRQEIKKKQ